MHVFSYLHSRCLFAGVVVHNDNFIIAIIINKEEETKNVTIIKNYPFVGVVMNKKAIINKKNVRGGLNPEQRNRGTVMYIRS